MCPSPHYSKSPSEACWAGWVASCAAPDAAKYPSTFGDLQGQATGATRVQFEPACSQRLPAPG